MTCPSARPKLAAYVQDELGAVESSAVQRHLVGCSDCHREYEYQARLNSPLRELPSVEPPPDLSMAIRIRVSAGASPGFWDRWQVHLRNLMRPVALPAAGGMLTALILFCALLPSFGSSGLPIRDDVPTILITQPHFKDASPFPVAEDILVEAWIDERGIITSFQILSPTQGGAELEEELALHSGNMLLTTRFEPATFFGQPTAGKRILMFRRITIRG